MADRIEPDAIGKKHTKAVLKIILFAGGGRGSISRFAHVTYGFNTAVISKGRNKLRSISNSDYDAFPQI